MELPKNIVQIGKPDKIHKIYIEDYVVSYIKQLNRTCEDRNVGLALYGKLFEEEGSKYYFLYGAAKIEGLQHRGAYLSQTEKEEIADVGNRYFEEYEFLAWCSLKGEPVEKLFVLLQGKGVEVEGYACFYEKNESMLNYMLLSGQASRESAKTETAEEESFEKTAGRSARGEWNASAYMSPASKENIVQMPVERPEKEEKAPKNEKNIIARKTGYMRMAAVGVFLVLCVIGITTLNDYGKLEDLQVVANQVIANITEQKLPDTQDAVVSGGNAVTGNHLEENQEVSSPVASTSVPVTVTPSPALATATPVPSPELATPVPAESTPTPASVTPAPVSESEVLSQATEVVPEYTSYTITKGDTLISICTIRYGSLDRLQEICEINSIADADNIQVGQTILLP